jgi:hypothetical protein
MKTIVLFAAASALIGLCACTPPTDKYGHWGKEAQPLKALTKLDCPEEKGDFKRTSIAPDGRSCTYAGDDDSTLELKLVNVSGGVDATLNGVENDVHALVPVNFDHPAAATPAAEAAAASAPASSSTASVSVSTSGGATNVSMHPAGGKLPNGRSSERDSGHDNVNIDLPMVHIHAGEDKAKVRVAGINIDADDSTDSAHIEGKNSMIGAVKIEAHEGEAIVRIDNSDANIRRRVQFSSDTAGPQGDYTAGYVAHGPRSGPLVVGVVRIKQKHHDNDDLFEDARKLVKDAAGG